LESAERAVEGFIVEWDHWIRDEQALREYYDHLADEVADKAHVASCRPRTGWSGRRRSH
jgi:hypothetical protein